jgi:hypothetical protein
MNKWLSHRLDEIAQGFSFNDKWLREAMDLKSNTKEEMAMLMRWRTGAETTDDRFALMDFAIKLRTQ